MPEPPNQDPRPSARRRPYRLGRRQSTVDQTRQRITAATFDLHATIGPSRTTVRAIADRAGVQRHTVYHHFPDLETLYLACTEHGIRITNMPQPARWHETVDRVDRVRLGLGDMFAWYRANEAMLANVLYDIDPTVPPPTTPDPFEVRLIEALDTLVEGWDVAADLDGRLRAVVSLGLGFETWRSLSRSGLSDDQAIGVLVGLVAGVADGSIPSTD